MPEREDMFDADCALCKQRITRERQGKNEGSIISVAVMQSNTVFDYGLSGEYKFKNHGLGLQEGDFVCIDCMEANEFEQHKACECSMCHEAYQTSIRSDNYLAGWGCAGHVEDRKGRFQIGCGFGSRHDCGQFPFTGETDLKVGDLVCDTCIEQMLAEGKVTEDRSFWEEMEEKAREPLPPDLVEDLRTWLVEHEAEHGPLPKPDPSEPTDRVPLHIPDPMNPIPRKSEPEEDGDQ